MIELVDAATVIVVFMIAHGMTAIVAQVAGVDHIPKRRDTELGITYVARSAYWWFVSGLRGWLVMGQSAIGLVKWLFTTKEEQTDE